MNTEENENIAATLKRVLPEAKVIETSLTDQGITHIALPEGYKLEAIDGEIEEMRFVTREELQGLNLAHWAKLVLPRAFGSETDPWWLRPT